MKPFFPYFGSKYRMANKYLPVRHSIIVEPFAGSAAFSVYHEPKVAILVDSNPVVCDIWRWLIAASPNDVMGLPTDFDSVDELDLPHGAIGLIRQWLSQGTIPSDTRRGYTGWAAKYKDSGACRVWGDPVKKRIAAQVDKIKSWEVINGGYELAPDIEATWFVDPPYSVAGKRYRKYAFSNYTELAARCYKWRGDVIVCENYGADWLPFKHLSVERTSSNKTHEEAVCYISDGNLI